jgi:hypothetical protein
MLSPNNSPEGDSMNLQDEQVQTPQDESSMPNLGRRIFITNIGIAATVLTATACQPGGSDTGKVGTPDLQLPDEMVEVTASIVWIPDGTPVEGAKIYDQAKNTFIGETGKDGKFVFQTKNGTVVRLVEPKYGQQQALRIIQGERTPNKNIRVAGVAEGWTIK